MKTPFFILPLLLFAVILHASNLHAANRVVVLGNSETPLIRNLVTELRVTGFDAAAITDEGEADLEEVARTNKASAAIRITPRGKKVEVWVADRMTGKIVARSVQVKPGQEPKDAIIVLAAVELLRASLMEIYTANPSRGDVQVAPETSNFAKPPLNAPGSAKDAPRLLIAAGPGFTYIGTDTGMSANMSALITWQIWGKLRFSALGIAPLTNHRFTEPEGAVTILPFAGAGEVSVAALPSGTRIRPVFGFGAGASHYRIRGAHNENFISENNGAIASETETITAPLAYLRIAVEAHMLRLLAVRMDLLAGWSLAENTVQISDREVAGLGRPWISVNFLVELTLW